MGEMNLSHIHYSIPPTAGNCTFFSAAHETFSRRDHILGHKENLNKSKKIKIKIKTIPCILTDHNEIIEINGKESHQSHLHSWKLNSILLNDQWVIEKN
jgi:hypothetical protein